MFEYLGTSGNFSFFSDGDNAVIVDTQLNLITKFGSLSTLQAEFSQGSYEIPSAETIDLVNDHFIIPNLKAMVAAGDGNRMYTIPGGVQSEAKKALKWRAEENRGGTPVGLNTARTLAAGGQIGIKKIRHIAKYFPRHEVDKKGKGWDMGEDNFPSNGRIAWALWGGDAGQRWASAIVERENKKALTAGAYGIPGYEDVVEEYGTPANGFQDAYELSENQGPEFIARVRHDATGIDRLYKIEIDGMVSVWDNCAWDSLGHVDGDIYTYDKALDDVYDTVEKTHVIIDPSSAVLISALLQARPFQPVGLEEIDLEEVQMIADAIDDIDWTLVERSITAAGDSMSDTKGPEYTPAERSAEVKDQPRDAKGLWVKKGSRVVVAGDPEKGTGQIVRVDPDSSIIDVKLDNGNTISVDAKFTEAEGGLKGGQKMVPSQENIPLDVSGILGEPRTPKNQPKAHLPGTLPPMTPKMLQQSMDDWSGYVADMRKSYKPSGAADRAQAKKNWGVTKFAGEAAIIAAGAAAKPDDAEVKMTPNNSDIPPKYLAIVSPEDPQAVMDLVAIVPDTNKSVAPSTFRRVDGVWAPDAQVLMDLKSATPPPVVELKEEDFLNEVLQQVDGIKKITASGIRLSLLLEDNLVGLLASLSAAGGVDRNRGNAEALREYWTRGKGAAKIRWGTPGDWTRCVRQLSKYMGTRAKGYCQLRHKDATGIFTGSRLNPGGDNNFDNAMIEAAALSARATEARYKFSLVAGAQDVSAVEAGAKFRIDMLIPEDLESGDGRKFKSNAIDIRELPLPLLWQIKTGDGHMGSVVVGRIDYMERTPNGIGNAYGVFDSGSYGREAERLVRNGFIRGVSADLDQFEAKEAEAEENSEKDAEVGKQKLIINHARVMAATIVAKPAFQECTIYIVDGDAEYQEEDMIPEDGIYEESVDSSYEAEALIASGFLESQIPVTPPQAWFEKPTMTKATPLTIDPDGRIYGHIAAWHVNHIGMPRSTRPPRSKSKYAYFHTGVVRTDAGKDIPVGQLTLAGGHASLNANAAAAAKHYDDTASAIADVHAGEDDYGIYVAGSLRPDATEAQIRALRASAPSGDWRPINGQLELVAVCQVNVPGFPIARALVASGKVFALVAAGAHYMATLQSEAVTTLVNRAQSLSELSANSPDLRSRVKSAKKAARTFAVTSTTSKVEELRERALVASAVAELANFTEEERAKLAEAGEALPDGSYPIRNEKDLKNAIKAYGRSNPKDRAKVRAHIRKRARALKLATLVPEEWKAAGTMEAVGNIERMRAVIAALPAKVEISEEDLKKLADAKTEADKQTEEEIQIAQDIADGKTTAKEVYDEEGRSKYTPVTQPRDAKGKYRKVLARLKQDLGVAGLQDALKQVELAENMDFAGNYVNSAKASTDLLGMIDRINSNALNPEALENVRLTAAELGKTIANLPLPFGVDADKLKFSDLPSGLKDLIEQMITRVEAKIGKEDADIATQDLRSYMSGADFFSQAEVQSQMATLLRLLT